MFRPSLLVILLLAAQPAIAACSDPITQLPQQVTLYRNGQVPLEGQAAQQWLPLGGAYSAGTYPIPFDQLKSGGVTVKCAMLEIDWQARSPSAYTGAGLFAVPSLSHAGTTELDSAATWWTFFAMNDSGFAPWTKTCGPVGPFTEPCCSGSGAGPHPCIVEITDALNALIDEGRPYFLAVGGFGNTKNGVYIYKAELRVTM